jgi:hypothetical protein
MGLDQDRILLANLLRAVLLDKKYNRAPKMEETNVVKS